jgi:hypothetical protein
MTMPIPNSACVRFSPAEVMGLPAVSEVAIHPEHVDVKTNDSWRTFAFRQFGRRQQPLLEVWFRRLVGRPAYPLIVGEREFCTDRRYIQFNSEPKLRIYTPPDFDLNYEDTFLARIGAVLRSGGFDTIDMS